MLRDLEAITDVLHKDWSLNAAVRIYDVPEKNIHLQKKGLMWLKRKNTPNQ